VERRDEETKMTAVIERMIRVCHWLGARMRMPGQVPHWRISNGFARLELLIERLPSDQTDAAERGYLRNRVQSSRRLWEGGESGAALYQVREMRRNLRSRVSP
jgi:hypothetical protein